MQQNGDRPRLIALRRTHLQVTLLPLLPQHRVGCLSGPALILELEDESPILDFSRSHSRQVNWKKDSKNLKKLTTALQVAWDRAGDLIPFPAQTIFSYMILDSPKRTPTVIQTTPHGILRTTLM